MNDSILQISDLDFAFGQRLVLKHISLEIPRGVTLGVIGANGGGKTTLIKLMLGLLAPARGTVRVAGLPAAQAVRRGDIVGYLPQSPRVPENFPLSVRQLVHLGLAGKIGLLGHATREDKQHVEWLLHKIGIEELADLHVGSLSGGQLQRMYIARALAARPKILLMDEPTTGIDRAGQDQFMEFVADLKKSLELTVVLVSHDLRTVSTLCDRVACVNVTLHYHDVTGNLPQELAREIFGTDQVAPCAG